MRCKIPRFWAWVLRPKTHTYFRYKGTEGSELNRSENWNQSWAKLNLDIGARLEWLRLGEVGKCWVTVCEAS